MALTVETGSGVEDSDSYASTSTIDTYWGNRTHDALYTTWNAATAAEKEGAAREASSYLDAIYGKTYRGYRMGNIQGLEFPRVQAMDDSGFPLPGLPSQIVQATCELAARALSGNLRPDATTGGSVKRLRTKVGELEKETEYTEGGRTIARHGFVDELLAPVLRVKLHWSWR